MCPIANVSTHLSVIILNTQYITGKEGDRSREEQVHNSPESNDQKCTNEDNEQNLSQQDNEKHDCENQESKEHLNSEKSENQDQETHESGEQAKTFPSRPRKVCVDFLFLYNLRMGREITCTFVQPSRKEK